MYRALRMAKFVLRSARNVTLLSSSFSFGEPSSVSKTVDGRADFAAWACHCCSRVDMTWTRIHVSEASLEKTKRRDRLVGRRRMPRG